MIDNLYLANLLEGEFNNNSLGKKFLIFADEGDMVKATKYGNYVLSFTHGLLETITSQITPIKNLRFQNWNMQLMLLCDLNKTGFVEQGDHNRLQSDNLIDTKQCIMEVFERLNGQTISIVDDNKTYSMTFALSLPTVGEKMSLGDISEGMPIYLEITMTLLENGVNSGDYKVVVDGEDMYFTSAVLSRIKVTEQNPNMQGNNTKASVLNNGLGVDLVVPQTTSPVCEKFEDELLDGTDKAYCVILQRGEKRVPYICTSLKTQQSIALVQNIGINISFGEAVEECLDFEENKWIAIEKQVGDYDLTKLFANKSNEEIVIFWGDGTKTISSAKEIEHTYPDAGNYVIYAYNTNAVNNDWFYEIFDVYNITYNLNGGEAENPVKYTTETETFTLNNPTKNGYEFLGWTGTDIDEMTKTVVISQGSVGDREYTANWRIITYTITYNLQDGTMSGNPSTYTVEDKVILNDAEKTGYTFDYWFDEEKGYSVFDIPKGTTGNKTLTAYYVPNEYNLYYDYGDGQTSPSAGPIRYPQTETFEFGQYFDSDDLYNPNNLVLMDDGGNITAVGLGWSIDGEEITSDSIDWKWTEDKTAVIIWGNVN